MSMEITTSNPTTCAVPAGGRETMTGGGAPSLTLVPRDKWVSATRETGIIGACFLPWGFLHGSEGNCARTGLLHRFPFRLTMYV